MATSRACPTIQAKFIGISLDEKSWDVVRPYLRKMRVNYRVVVGDARTAYKYGGVDSLPVTFLVDRQGNCFSRNRCPVFA